VKAIVRVLLGFSLAWIAAAADPSYVVVRLSSGAGREVVSRSGAIEVSNPDVREDEMLVLATETQIESLQNEPAVQLIYPASDELISGLPTHGCGRKDQDEIGELLMPVGRGWNNGTRTSAKLTYSFGYISPKISPERMSESVQNALAEWSRYVQVDFTRTNRVDATRNLNFSFFKGDHGDKYPFDGRGRMLAHTFYPGDVNSEPIAGDLHFDEDENWENGVDPDLYSVVLHELGHALGLGHADKPGAIMYPYYRKLESLQREDINAIRTLYATRPETVVDTPTSVLQPSPPSNSEVSAKDRTSPSLSITSPRLAISSTSASTVRITGTASDSGGIKSITWTASGGRSGVARGTTSWSISDFALRTGDNTIIVRAWDEAGNTSWRSFIITRR